MLRRLLQLDTASTAIGILSRRFLQKSALLSMPDVIVPQMGDSISEGTVATILKNQGSNVLIDETILQIETDKVGGGCMRANAASRHAAPEPV